jgi:hypothetical protein
MLYNAGSIPVILFIGAIADLFGMNNVLYLLTVSAITFGLWSLYYEHKYKYSLPLRFPARMQNPEKSTIDEASQNVYNDV